MDAVGAKKKKSVTNNPLGSFSKATSMEQRDRSLTVMIPRAKYHPQASKPGNLIDIEGYKSKSSSNTSVNQAKLINYLDASPSSSKSKNVRCLQPFVSFKSYLKIILQNVPCEKSNYQQPQNPGALVSAGFKVSAAGGGGNGSPVSDANQHKKSRISKTTSHQNITEVGSKYYAVHKLSTMSEQPIKLHDEKSQISVVRKSYR